ncbi:LamG domain-containing protein [Taibaiella soli]|uniref:LamG-like jellyroll fold domain-containing protein n=1 Tax=Taibaiella soli TaxID=1649169 RepID=A0A2W2AVV5_9BACT|nr:LamG domain-containing protein [Taibaiella soli]PZF72104.1 hypothetical protein DN068_14305 [Taibaiella soli]
MRNIILTCSLTLAIAIFFSCNKKESENKSTGGNVVTGTCLPSGLNSGVLAFYPFGNGSILDVSGNGHDLTNATNAVSTTDRAGNMNCAYLFNGQNFLTNANAAFLNNLNQFSISLWYEPLDTSSHNVHEYQVLICKDTGNTGRIWESYWSIGLYDCSRAVFLAKNNVWDKLIINIDQNDCYNEIAARTGSWHHLAATYDASGNSMKIYRDGVLQASDVVNPLTSPIINIGDLTLGKYFTGKIDDIIIYNRALSQTEVTQLSQLATCCN